MRELKFRFWNKIDKDFIKCNWWSWNMTINDMFLDMDKYYLIPSQYIWQKDKNWKEIYIWDIIYKEWYWKKWLIDWDKDFPRIIANFWPWTWWGDIKTEYCFWKTVEIIWNIYENPNLIDN